MLLVKLLMFTCLLSFLPINSLSQAPANLVSSQKTSGNPVLPGWYADPEGVVFQKQYWIYPTYSDAFDKQLFFDAFSSPDLIKWTKHSHILKSTAVKWAKRAMWAPSVIEKNGQYFMFFCANDIQYYKESYFGRAINAVNKLFGAGKPQYSKDIGGIGVAVANNPAGPFRDYLGKPLIGQIYNGAQPIDQFVFQDKDGQYYIMYGGWKHCNIARLKNDFTGFTPFPDGTTFREITPKNYVEGPTMFNRNGQYYFMWSEGDWTGPDYSVAYAVSKSPLGPFKRVGRILQPNPAIANGTGHHSVIQVPGTDEWYIVYHRRPLTETDGSHRQTCIDRLYFDKQGIIKPVKITVEGVQARPIK